MIPHPPSPLCSFTASPLQTNKVLEQQAHPISTLSQSPFWSIFQAHQKLSQARFSSLATSWATQTQILKKQIKSILISKPCTTQWDLLVSIKLLQSEEGQKMRLTTLHEHNYFIHWPTFLRYKNRSYEGVSQPPLRKIMFYLLLFQLTILLSFVWLLSEAG